MSDSLVSSTPSGVLGLAQDHLAGISGGSTILSRLVSDHKLQSNVLGIRLVKSKQMQSNLLGLGGGDGGYSFGHIETQWIVGGAVGLTWIPVTSINYW